MAGEGPAGPPRPHASWGAAAASSGGLRRRTGGVHGPGPSTALVRTADELSSGSAHLLECTSASGKKNPKEILTCGYCMCVEHSG